MSPPKLNLPESDLKIVEKDGLFYVWDDIRKKEILLTPEEWVRQNFLSLLIKHLHYPRSWTKVESGFSYNRKRKRSDIEVLKKDGSAFLLVECKAPQIKITEKSLTQISIYNKTLRADYVGITNGMIHLFWQFDQIQTRYNSISKAPEYPF